MADFWELTSETLSPLAVPEPSWWDQASNFLNNTAEITAKAQVVTTNISQLLGQAQTALGSGGTQTPSPTQVRTGTPQNPGPVISGGGLNWAILLVALAAVVYFVKRG